MTNALRTRYGEFAGPLRGQRDGFTRTQCPEEEVPSES